MRISDKKHALIAKIAQNKDDYHSVVDRLNFEWFNDSQELTEMIEELQSDYVIDWAQRLLIPVPPRSQKENDTWIGSNRTGNMRLTRSAVLDLRKALRLEEKESFEAWSRWQGSILQIVTNVVSILSLVVAIIALHAKH